MRAFTSTAPPTSIADTRVQRGPPSAAHQRHVASTASRPRHIVDPPVKYPGHPRAHLAPIVDRLASPNVLAARARRSAPASPSVSVTDSSSSVDPPSPSTDTDAIVRYAHSSNTGIGTLVLYAHSSTLVHCAHLSTLVHYALTSNTGIGTVVPVLVTHPAHPHASRALRAARSEGVLLIPRRRGAVRMTDA